MAQFFLSLEIDRLGITARVNETGLKKTVVIEECAVLYKDLQEADDFFKAGLESISSSLDIKKCSTAVLFISPSLVFFRSLTLPFKSARKVEQVLGFELKNLLPIPDESVHSDFYLLSSDLEENLFFTASIRESVLDSYVTALHSFGIKPLLITPNGYAAALSLLNENQAASSFIFLHLRAHENILVLATDKKPWVVRSFLSSQSPEQFVKGIKQTLIGFKQKTGIQSSLDMFVAYQDQALYPRELDAALQAAFANDEASPGVFETFNAVDLLASITPNRGWKFFINFCKGKYGSFSFFKEYSKQIATTCFLAILAFMVSVASIHTDIQQLERDVFEIDKKMDNLYRQTFPLTKKIQDPYLELKANVLHLLKNQTGSVNKDRKNQKSPTIDVLLDLSKRIPASIDLNISRLILNDSRLILSGTTDNFNTVDKIKNNLENIEMFKKVTISSAISDKKSNRVELKFIIDL